MAEEVKVERRAYHSPLRADQAQQTRRRVLESARRLFVAHGYAGTTVAAVADDAGVSPETIYLTLGGKRGLLEGVMDITGPHDTAEDDETWWHMVAGLATATERLDEIIAYSCRILARTRLIHAIIRGAADKEAFAADLGHRLLAERLANQTERIRRYIGDELRPELSVAEAGQRYCALASPELYWLLIVELGWSPEQHQRWLTELLRSELLGERGEAAPSYSSTMTVSTQTMTDEQRKSVAIEYLKAFDRGGVTSDGGSILDLFADDAQVYFPKWGLANGKEEIGRLFGDVGGTLESIVHHFSHFNWVFSGSDVVVCEGTSHGEHRDGPWRAGAPESGAGRWCDVFEIRDWKIQRCFIYLDPDYAGGDIARYPWLSTPNDG